MIVQGDPNLNPNWNNTGLTTSVGQAYGLTLGYAEASDLFLGGEEWLAGSGVKINGSGDGSVLPSQVLVRFTYYGDVNLDGVVDRNDYFALLGNLDTAHDYPGATTAFRKSHHPAPGPARGWVV